MSITIAETDYPVTLHPVAGATGLPDYFSIASIADGNVWFTIGQDTSLVSSANAPTLVGSPHVFTSIGTTLSLPWMPTLGNFIIIAFYDADHESVGSGWNTFYVGSTLQLVTTWNGSSTATVITYATPPSPAIVAVGYEITNINSTLTGPQLTSYLSAETANSSLMTSGGAIVPNDSSITSPYPNDLVLFEGSVIEALTSTITAPTLNQGLVLDESWTQPQNPFAAFFASHVVNATGGTVYSPTPTFVRTDFGTTPLGNTSVWSYVNVAPFVIGRITSTGTQTKFPLDDFKVPGQEAVAIAQGPTNEVWHTRTTFYNYLLPSITKNVAFTAYDGTGFTGTYGASAATNDAALAAITLGPDGNMWIADSVDSSALRVTPGGAVSTFPNSSSLGPQSGGNIVSTSGYLWFSNNLDGISSVSVTGTFTSFPPPSNYLITGCLAVGNDGNLWGVALQESPFIEVFFKMTPAGVYTFFAPDFELISGSLLCIGPDGALWVYSTDDVGANPSFSRCDLSGNMTQYLVPNGLFLKSICTSGSALWAQTVPTTTSPTSMNISKFVPSGPPPTPLPSYSVWNVVHPQTTGLFTIIFPIYTIEKLVFPTIPSQSYVEVFAGQTFVKYVAGPASNVTVTMPSGVTQASVRVSPNGPPLYCFASSEALP